MDALHSVELAWPAEGDARTKGAAGEGHRTPNHRPKNGPEPVCSSQVPHGHSLRGEV